VVAARRPRIAARADERAAVLAEVACEAATSRELSTPVLVAGDATGAIAEALAERGVDARAWSRFAGSAVAARDVSPWPPVGPFGTIVARVPRDRASFEMNAALFASRVARGGAVVVYGSNDEGVRAAPNVLGTYFGQVRLVDTRRRARVYEARQALEPREAGTDEREPWRAEITCDAPGAGRISLVTYPGVFARDRLDDGTRLLLEALAEGALADTPASGNILDFACGHGIVARVLRTLLPHARTCALDADALAVEAARENVPEAEAVVSDAWSRWDDLAHVSKSAALDAIVSNPPFHRGRAEDFSVFEELVVGGAQRLAPGGSLTLVAQRTAGAGRLMKRAFPRARVVHESTRYQVWRGLAGRG
jgi:16S rRNA (guanine1207-N2)-methyltransferase